MTLVCWPRCDGYTSCTDDNFRTDCVAGRGPIPCWRRTSLVQRVVCTKPKHVGFTGCNFTRLHPLPAIAPISSENAWADFRWCLNNVYQTLYHHLLRLILNISGAFAFLRCFLCAPFKIQLSLSSIPSSFVFNLFSSCSNSRAQTNFHHAFSDSIKGGLLDVVLSWWPCAVIVVFWSSKLRTACFYEVPGRMRNFQVLLLFQHWQIDIQKFFSFEEH